MATARPLLRFASEPARGPGRLFAFPGAKPSAPAPSVGVSLATSHGVVVLDFADPAAPRATADLEAGSFQVDGLPLGVSAPFAYSEASDAFVMAFSTDPICWTAPGRLAPIDTAFSAVEAVQDAIAVLVHENPRLLAVARVETMSRRLRALDAEIGATADASKGRIRAELSRELIAARRGLMAEAVTLAAV